MVVLAFFDLLRLHSKHTREAVSAPMENITTEEAATETPTGTPSDIDDPVDSSSVIVIVITTFNTAHWDFYYLINLKGSCTCNT